MESGAEVGLGLMFVFVVGQYFSESGVRSTNPEQSRDG